MKITRRSRRGPAPRVARRALGHDGRQAARADSFCEVCGRLAATEPTESALVATTLAVCASCRRRGAEPLVHFFIALARSSTAASSPLLGRVAFAGGRYLSPKQVLAAYERARAAKGKGR